MLNWTACLFLLAITFSKQSARCIHWQWAHHVCTGVQVTLGWPCGWIATNSTKEILQSITSYAPYAPYYLGVIRSSDQLVICQRGKTRGASLVLPQYLLWHATLWGASFCLRHYEASCHSRNFVLLLSGQHSLQVITRLARPFQRSECSDSSLITFPGSSKLSLVPYDIVNICYPGNYLCLVVRKSEIKCCVM